ncbi:hypothetical protein F511_24121 [Dorcoceras hygrometricum]|uniref:Uncharacterized protein n=1 Tax=Dorcoceras hygrometricum TaxID=472368 RepID=A0A2Z7D671_9LAMI|nr:hypothetical protein F511_24121 [Dorcoceras hygrometricum]
MQISSGLLVQANEGITSPVVDLIDDIYRRLPTGIPKRSVYNVQYNIQIVDSLSLPSSDTIAVETVVNTKTDSTVAVDTSQCSTDADLVSPRLYSDSPMHFTTADIPRSDEPTVFLLPDLTNVFAQLRALVDQISLEHVQTRVHIERVKAEFFAKISIIESLLLTRANNKDRAVKPRSSVMRGRDDKKREVGNSQCQGPQPPPDDRNRPGGGGGSRSEPVKKRGSSSQSGGGRTRKRGFRYWITG